MKPIDVGDIHNKHEDQFEKMLKGKLLNQKETLIKATTTGIETKLFECNSSESPRTKKLDRKNGKKLDFVVEFQWKKFREYLKNQHFFEKSSKNPRNSAFV